MFLDHVRHIERDFGELLLEVYLPLLVVHDLDVVYDGAADVKVTFRFVLLGCYCLWGKGLEFDFVVSGPDPFALQLVFQVFVAVVRFRDLFDMILSLHLFLLDKDGH